jgi:hypothetical protein
MSRVRVKVEARAVMPKNIKTTVSIPTEKDSRPVAPEALQPRAMSLEKAKKLIRKTSDDHKGLFRRLAK